MGLFDFARNVGDKVFDSTSQAPEKIKQHLEKNNPGVQNLEVVVEAEVAHLKGKAESVAAAEKIALMAGNIKGVERVDLERLDKPPFKNITQFYEVQAEDTLSKIAQHFYKDSSLHIKLFEANKEIIQDPDLLYEGQKIRIPNINNLAA